MDFKNIIYEKLGNVKSFMKNRIKYEK